MSAEKTLKVIDSSCTAEYPVREHHIKIHGEIIPVVFKYGEDKILPYEQALKFVTLAGFTVKDDCGAALVVPAVAKDNIKASLPKDEAVANLAELTLSSLILRAGQKPGGEVYLDAGEEDRADIIAFLIGEPPVKAPAEAVAEPVVEAEVAEEGDALPETKAAE